MKLYKKGLVTENEFKRMKREGVSTYQLTHIQCIKPPGVVSRIADVLSELKYKEPVRQLKGG